MRVDIDKLTEAQLIDLNHRIVARLKMLAELRAHDCMLAPHRRTGVLPA